MEMTEKLRLNAYVERLIDSAGTDAEARVAVAEFGRTLSAARKFEIEASVTKSGGTASGETDEMGTVEVEDEAPSTKEVRHGTPKARVGYYSIWRERTRRKDWIVISHFWKSEVETASETEFPQEWVLALDRAGQPHWFAERGFRLLFSFHVTKAAAIEVSREIFPQLWGVDDATEHRGAVAVNVVVTME